MSIEAQIRKSIQQSNDISIASFMEIAMSLNSNSYYISSQPLGKNGDFITSPEISQLFGEIIGVWVFDIWEKLGRAEQLNIVELGPGRGLLMKDLLRATKKISNFHKALNIYLLDVNPRLIKIQKENLYEYRNNIKWIKNLSEVREVPTIFIANEFFDALPIHQYVKIKNHWHENMVSIRPDNNQLFFKQKPVIEDFSSYLNKEHPHAFDGAIIEEASEGIKWMQEISDILVMYKGAALIIDYGYNIAPSERKATQYYSTLQGVKNHKYHPILENIGMVDLSAHVDFYLLSKIAAAREIKNINIKTQAEFLKEFGIDLRLALLIKQNPELTEILNRQYNRLISEKQMGTLFKVLDMSLL